MIEDQREGAPALIFGESLFDVFAEQQVPGGAPFNLAWNLCGLGDRPRLMTRIGDDARGRELIETMEAWELDTRLVQKDPERPTGVVQVRIKAGQPRFEILADQAYDHIEWDEGVSGQAWSVLYHGTLALRSESSRRTLERLRERVEAPRFVDVNLRAPWYRIAEVKAFLRGADFVKLSDEEAKILGEGSGASFGALREELGVGALIVSCGPRGLLIFDGERDGRRVPAPTVEALVDTVGAGDAVSAALIFGLGRGWSLDRAAALGVRLGSLVCGLRGATTPERSFYLSALDA